MSSHGLILPSMCSKTWLKNIISWAVNVQTRRAGQYFEASTIYTNKVFSAKFFICNPKEKEIKKNLWGEYKGNRKRIAFDCFKTSRHFRFFFYEKHSVREYERKKAFRRKPASARIWVLGRFSSCSGNQTSLFLAQTQPDQVTILRTLARRSLLGNSIVGKFLSRLHWLLPLPKTAHANAHTFSFPSHNQLYQPNTATPNTRFKLNSWIRDSITFLRSLNSTLHTNLLDMVVWPWPSWVHLTNLVLGLLDSDTFLHGEGGKTESCEPFYNHLLTCLLSCLGVHY